MTRRRRPRTFRKVEDLETHDEVNLRGEQLADYWGVSMSAISKWARTGAMAGFRVGRALRFKRAAALAFEKKAGNALPGRA